ncbi:hypothetical protein [Paenibacillus xylanexedens]|uniref:DUF4325 domain-containing protein n=1 Tax=Paenibacillus xylanexedens TaxID=528191 RepID=A0ABS4S1D0_PAEXY|nr:hypothetical protein [Paenibacillus xylanexedens]MBP2248938.1 hypothetical protein [Paenibacillus xylanexedens]
MERFEVNIAQTFGDSLWGRELGKSVRDKIVDSFIKQSENVLLLNFNGVNRIDFSCASEIVSILILRLAGELKGSHLVLTGLSTFVEENVDAALYKAELCSLFLIDNDEWKLIGKFSDTLQQTLAKVIELGQADTPTLAAKLNITVTSCNNRLKTLVMLGLVNKEEVSSPSGGKQYIYKSIL